MKIKDTNVIVEFKDLKHGDFFRLGDCYLFKANDIMAFNLTTNTDERFSTSKSTPISIKVEKVKLEPETQTFGSLFLGDTFLYLSKICIKVGTIQAFNLEDKLTFDIEEFQDVVVCDVPWTLVR